ncbi:hypothetical protein CEXT_619071 [Caerostris extrusa]|uniref:Uncharacterized protein n=1 Tax=Caerostris extrusa TaxID=172846 RepID=A0AAV4T7D9_CAEEX|nr:hypothetical protein CEXT_619071 [Caerostris extrusa]
MTSVYFYLVKKDQAFQVQGTSDELEKKNTMDIRCHKIFLELYRWSGFGLARCSMASKLFEFPRGSSSQKMFDGIWFNGISERQ